jgi:hypothetical protein
MGPHPSRPGSPGAPAGTGVETGPSEQLRQSDARVSALLTQSCDRPQVGWEITESRRWIGRCRHSVGVESPPNRRPIWSGQFTMTVMTSDMTGGLNK